MMIRRMLTSWFCGSGLGLGLVTSASAFADVGGSRDAVLLRLGYFMVSSSGTLVSSNALMTDFALEFSRSFTPWIEMRTGLRLAQNSELDRTQVQEFLLGARYFPFSMGSDFSGPIENVSLKWSFLFKPYLEAQGSLGHFIGLTIGEPPVYDLASDYFGFGGGLGCRVQIIDRVAVDLGGNFQMGYSYSAVVLDPTIIHGYLGVHTTI